MPTVRRTRPWTTKPPVSAQINWGHPWAQSLKGFYALNENAGTTIADASGNLPIVATGFGSTSAWTASGSQISLNCNAARFGAQGTLPTALQFGPPVTLAVGMRMLGAADLNALLVGLYLNNTATSEYGLLLYFGASTTSLALYVPTAPGTDTLVEGLYIPPVGSDIVLSVTLSSTTYALYANGNPVASGSVTFNPTYTASAMFGLGNVSGYSRNTNALIYWGGWWNRSLAAAEHAALGASPNAIWKIFQPARGIWQIPSFGTASVTASIGITAGNDLLAAPGMFTAPAAIAITESQDTFGASSSLTIAATAAITAGSDTAAIVAAFTISGSAAITAGSDGLTGTGLLTTPAVLAGTEAADTLAALGIFGTAASLSATERADVLAMLAGFGTSGAITLGELRDTFAGMNVPANVEPTFNPFAATLIPITHNDPTRAEIDPYAATLLSIGITDPTRAETDPYAAKILA